jgi:hypothetical protein
MGTKVPERILREVEAEFPNDYALQQVHIARRLLSIEARKAGGLTRLLKKSAKERLSRSATSPSGR